MRNQRYAGSLAQRRQQEQAAQRRAMLGTAAVVVLIVVLLGLIAAFQSKLALSIDKLSNPTPRQDVVVVQLLSTSKSDAMLRPLGQVAAESDTLLSMLAGWLGNVRTIIMRFASKPVPLYDGRYNMSAVRAVLTKDYATSNPDPVPGTFLAPALRATFEATPDNSFLVICVGTDAWEDTAAVRQLLSEMASKRDFILLVHSIPTHNPRNLPVQLNLRGSNQQSVAVLGERALVVGHADFGAAVKPWLLKHLEQRNLFTR